MSPASSTRGSSRSPTSRVKREAVDCRRQWGAVGRIEERESRGQRTKDRMSVWAMSFSFGWSGVAVKFGARAGVGEAVELLSSEQQATLEKLKGSDFDLSQLVIRGRTRGT